MLKNSVLLKQKINIIQQGEYLNSSIIINFFSSNIINRSHFAGPMTLFACIHFIQLCKTNLMANERLQMNVDDILEIFSTNSSDFNNELVQLYELAKEYFLNLYICIIEQNGKYFYSLNSVSEQENQELLRAFLVYDKRNRSFYAFYRDDNNTRYTTFSTDDTFSLESFKNSVDRYNWPGYFGTMQPLSDQDISVLHEQSDEKTNAVDLPIGL